MQALLFDLDGTLVASEPLKGRALAAACASYGAGVPAAAYGEVMGRDWAAVTGHFFALGGLAPDRAEFDRRFRQSYLALIEAELTATPGALALVAAAAAGGAKVGLVSSAASWMVETILARIGHPRFDVVITQEHVTRHKPDPAAYRLALATLGVGPDRALAFEDSAAGVAAARGAGCRCIAIRHGLNGGHDFALADRVVASFDQVLAEGPGGLRLFG